MNKVKAYIDGGCRGNGKVNNIGGWGIHLEYKDKTFEQYGYEKNTTNNRMELTSCIMALKTLNPSKAIEIYTDSNYVYKCLEEEKWYIKWRKNNWKSSTKKAVENKDLWITLLDLYEGFKNIKIFKVEGHADNEGNIRADALANQGMDLGENIANV